MPLWASDVVAYRHVCPDSYSVKFMQDSNWVFVTVNSFQAFLRCSTDENGIYMRAPVAFGYHNLSVHSWPQVTIWDKFEKKSPSWYSSDITFAARREGDLDIWPLATNFYLADHWVQVDSHENLKDSLQVFLRYCVHKNLLTIQMYDSMDGQPKNTIKTPVSYKNKMSEDDLAKE